MFSRLIYVVVLSAGSVIASEQASCLAASPDFESQIIPILLSRCLECHQSGNPSGGLAIDSAAALLKGGDSGEVIRPGHAADSLMFRRIESGEMPPAKNGHERRLSKGELELIRGWIDAGAAYPEQRRLDLFEKTIESRAGRDWWAFQPLKVVVPPQLDSVHGPVHPIDAFIWQKHREQGLSGAPEATAAALTRRLWWDLTGLPPGTFELPQGGVELSDGVIRVDAYEQLVDQLLASPQYGERWARHWLDVVRFADTSGYERDQTKPFAWKYRDWVVNAFNVDMPWDDFIRHQLAGDEIEDRTEQSVIATGFLRLGTWNDEPNDPSDYTYERLEDLVHTTSTAFLGLTTKCARCHDHKFDPIPQTDYYRMAAVFWPGPIHPRSSELLGGPTAAELGMADVLGWTDITTAPAALHLLKNGERLQPLQAVSAGALTCFPGTAPNFTAGRTSAGTTGLRLQLANWIADPGNPLTARVVVNRIWMHHFGEGLVRSTNNFGFTGDQPTHPELLDWLSGELIRSGWSVKHIHRLILTSSTWKQSSIHPRERDIQLTDSANRYLWRMFRRRMDAESLRDALLASSEELDLRAGGPGFVASVSPEALEGLSRKGSAWSASPESEQRRRSLYMFSQRSLLPPMMTAFDLCDSTLPCGRRDTTIVAPQALTLLNNEFSHNRSEHLAARILNTAERSVEQHITEVWQQILQREPGVEELGAASRHLEQQLAYYHRMADTVNDGVSGPPIPAQMQSVLKRIHSGRDHAEAVPKLPEDCVLYLDPAQGLELSDRGTVVRWQDQSVHGHDATQDQAEFQPEWRAAGITGQPTVNFDGSRQFLHLTGSLLRHDDCTVVAVVTDRAENGHRELISNWSGQDGNSVTSFFVGMTGEHSIRLSDAISGVGEIQDRQNPFLLTATNGDAGAFVFQTGRAVASQTNRLPSRKLDTPWVIGQQGNITGEYWNGETALLLVFSRQLTREELDVLWTVIAERFQLASRVQEQQKAVTPEQRALASLCLVLFNSNEFAFID